MTAGIRSYTVAGVTVAERVSGTGGGLWWLSPDPVGTVGLQIGVATGVVTRRWMDPYGANRGDSTAWSSLFGYLNAPASATGLTQLGARAYDPGLGRFITVDPALDTSEPRHGNAYAYSYNSPVSFSDPTGLVPHPMLSDGGPVPRAKASTSSKSATPAAPGNTSSGKTKTSGKSFASPSSKAAKEAEKQRAAVSNGVHGALTIFGLIPGVGEIADGLDALLYLAEGDPVSAGLSAASMIPFVGWLGSAAKGARLVGSPTPARVL